jgi:hypothetical protein
MMHKEMTDDERVLMIEAMIERGEVYHGYKNEIRVACAKQHKKRTSCTKEKFMSAYSPELPWRVIAEKLKISESFCLKLSHEYLDYRRPSVWIKVTDEQIIQAFKDHAGDKLITIAKKLNIHSSSLLARARKLKIRP